jgi:hypothetical protein
MNGGEPKPGRKRELTYRVGWKSGKLEIGENGKVTVGESGLFYLESAATFRLLGRLAWKEVPFAPLGALKAVLCVLPVFVFMATWAIVYLLMQTG